ncbi:MAG: ABC transporter ATP-binding protein, partial [Opitutales bacterium]
MDEPEIMIWTKGLSKTYRIWKDDRARLRAPILRAVAGLMPFKGARNAVMAKSRACWCDFTALSDIDLKVPRGQCLGIVGRNGSGKSTLLQLVCGILRPSAGGVDVRGRVAALLELGSGFNPEFTGRENVFLNASILGLTQDEVKQRFGEIVEFADIGDFVEQPVKTYSSGMMLRLAFAVQVLVDPDVLIVDEALSVGDEPFQRKCFARLERLRESGVTVLFVSHDMTPILNLCDRAILLHKGRLLLDSTPKLVASVYQRFNHAPAARAEALLA